ncbi:unnamed protein product [Pleuronectes platessa]|uniref:Uncharacterized protein n=1 Tax=Pleuronectes platessa TaxID=8262 RepID=A0A9N7YDC8_PLEPL|nr:unnamed protein product [Pleuronectes platessa]
MGSDHRQLLLHTTVRWLLLDKVLTRLFELRDEKWQIPTSVASDIKKHLGTLKTQLQRYFSALTIPETGGDEEPAFSDTDEGSANTGAAARLAKLARSYL